MQVFGDMSANGKLMAVVIIVIVLIALAALGLLVFRLSARRLNTAGNGRSRQPRLGVVDAFDLDRQRQLVIVRRDNIEHLLMIGGPNDVLIESSIVRAASSAPVGTARDKESTLQTIPANAPPAPLGPAPALVPAPAASPAPPLPSSAPIPVASAPGDSGPMPPVVPAPPRPAQDQPAPVTSPPRQVGPTTLPPRPGPGFTPRPQMPGTGVQNAGTATKPVFPPASRPAPIPRPGPIPPTRQGPPAGPRLGDIRKADDAEKAPALQPEPLPAAGPEGSSAPEISIGAPAVTKEPAPSPRVRPEPRVETPTGSRAASPPPSRPTPSPAPAQPVKPAPVPSLDALESLEEEMAKLLGRPVPPAEKL